MSQTTLPQIPAEEILLRSELRLLDVRSEGEFAEGHIPGSTNIPLLRDHERHLVGIAYKQEGPDAAVRLGHELVAPDRDARVAAWRSFFAGSENPVLLCFRGGMRSQISQSWLAEAGVMADRVKGGYKAIRRRLVQEWELPLSGFVVTGLTGSAKTQFLRSLQSPGFLDLEALASHRGSAFGGLFQAAPQPSQQTFENALALSLLQKRHQGTNSFLLEDESRLVGRCVIPDPFFHRMRVLPRIFLESSESERVAHIFEEYVAAPLRAQTAREVESQLVGAVRTLKNRLGGLAAVELEAAVRKAFAAKSEDESISLHREWIRRLLLDYYDRLYAHAMARHPQEPVFRGTASELREWLKQH